MKTFAQLRTETSLWLDDPKLTRFDAELLRTLLNMAYPMVVGLVESVNRFWNVSNSKINITLDAADQTYPIEDDSVPRAGVRRVIDLRRVVGTRRPQIPLLVMTEVDRSGGHTMYPDLWGNPQQPGAVLTRISDGDAGACWSLYFPTPPPPGPVEVTFVPTVEVLIDDAQVPRMVPGDYHHVIAMRAALIAKGLEERTNSDLPAEYQEQARMMMAECGTLVAGRSQRI